MGSSPTKFPRDGDKIRDKFIFSYMIGKGGFGKVYSAFHIDSKEWFAIKKTNIRKILTHKNGFKLLNSELQALQRVGRHPCIVALNSAFHDDRFCYMALDLCVGGDLRYHMKRRGNFPESNVAFTVACIGSALHHCHLKGVLHRDVKPENILIDETGYALLTDFGVAFSSDSFKNHPSLDLICHLSSGTRQYLAPEVFTPSHTHGCASDFWSLGVVAFEMVYGHRPFDSHCPLDMIKYAQQHLTHCSQPKGSMSVECHPPACHVALRREGPVCFVDQGCQLHCMNNSKSSADLHMTFPDMSPSNGYVSSSCRRVLRGLFSVNQSRRLGHGEKNYTSLVRDNWFEECGVDLGQVQDASARSPFSPNLKEVSMDLCQMHNQDAKVGACVSLCSTCDEGVVPGGESVGKEGKCGCGHRSRVLAVPGVQAALNDFFFVAPEYSEYDPALDDLWVDAMSCHKVQTKSGNLDVAEEVVVGVRPEESAKEGTGCEGEGQGDGRRGSSCGERSEQRELLREMHSLEEVPCTV